MKREQATSWFYFRMLYCIAITLPLLTDFAVQSLLAVWLFLLACLEKEIRNGKEFLGRRLSQITITHYYLLFTNIGVHCEVEICIGHIL